MLLTMLKVISPGLLQTEIPEQDEVLLFTAIKVLTIAGGENVGHISPKCCGSAGGR